MALAALFVMGLFLLVCSESIYIDKVTVAPKTIYVKHNKLTGRVDVYVLGTSNKWIDARKK